MSFESRAVQTLTVRRVLLDFARQLRDIWPATGAPSLVQLCDIAHGLVAFVVVLVSGQLPQDDVDRKSVV